MSRLPVPFDNPATYTGHSGVDYGQPAGTPFRASDSGVVTWLGRNERGGYFIWVKYDSIGPKVGYHHMPSHAACPREGSHFAYGDVLGVVGSTGRSTGPHLHSEVEGHATTDGYWQYFDPSRIVASGAAAGGYKGDEMSAEAELAIFQIRDYLGANGGLNTDTPSTVGYRVRDIQLALTNALPALLATSTSTDTDAIARAVVAAIPADIAQDVLDGLAERLKQ